MSVRMRYEGRLGRLPINQSPPDESEVTVVSTISQWTLDVQDVEVMGRFWAGALGYRMERGEDGCAKLYPPADAPGGTLTVWLQASAGPKTGKNRNHPDLTVADGQVDDEVKRLIGLGASTADVGQTGNESFVVLADPEGNEFCLLRRQPREV
jgi:glyoxalase superfamily protein